MEACVGAHHLSRKLKALGHDARLMPAKYVRPYAKGQKNDFRDAEAIAEAVQRPTMKFVATKTRAESARPAGAAPGAGTTGQPAHRHHQSDSRLPVGARLCGAAGVAVFTCRATAHPCYTPGCPVATHSAGYRGLGWRLAHFPLDERVESLSHEIEAVARQDAGCERLMSVSRHRPQSSPARWWQRSALEMGSLKAATSAPASSDWCLPADLNPETVRSSGKISRRGNRYLRVLFVQAAWVVLLTGRRAGSAMGSSPGSRQPRSGCIATFLRSRSPTSWRASPGVSWLMAGPSKRGRSMRLPSNLFDRHSTPTITGPREMRRSR